MVQTNSRVNSSQPYCGMTEFHCLVVVLFSAVFSCYLLDYPCEMDFGISRKGIRGVNFHAKFGLGSPNYNNSGSKNLEIPRNSKFIANRTWNS